MLNAFLYLGKDESRTADLTLGEHAVLCLLQPYTKSRRNVTQTTFHITASGLVVETTRHKHCGDYEPNKERDSERNKNNERRSSQH